jgi:hypothetical protein
MRMHLYDNLDERETSEQMEGFKGMGRGASV